jgi:hypothetical protein
VYHTGTLALHEHTSALASLIPSIELSDVCREQTALEACRILVDANVRSSWKGPFQATAAPQHWKCIPKDRSGARRCTARQGNGGQSQTMALPAFINFPSFVLLSASRLLFEHFSATPITPSHQLIMSFSHSGSSKAFTRSAHVQHTFSLSV